jgi:hypothetical protein
MPAPIGRSQKQAESRLKRELHITRSKQQYAKYIATDGTTFLFNPNDPKQEQRARRAAGHHQRTVANPKMGSGG